MSENLSLNCVDDVRRFIAYYAKNGYECANDSIAKSGGYNDWPRLSLSGGFWRIRRGAGARWAIEVVPRELSLPKGMSVASFVVCASVAPWVVDELAALCTVPVDKPSDLTT